MQSGNDERFARIDRLSFGRLVLGLMTFAFGAGIAIGLIVLGIDYFSEKPTWLSVASILLAMGPIAAWGLFVAGGELLALKRWIGRLRTRVDLDAPEIAIPRQRPARVAPTLGILWFVVFFSGFMLYKFSHAELEIGTVIGAAVFFLFFVFIPLRNLWQVWRWKVTDFAPLVLDRKGLLDRSLRDRPRIPWRDIAAIDLESGIITLVGDTRKWAEATVPDRGWFARLRGQRPAPRFTLNGGLQPSYGYALLLVNAYWQRRMARHGVDRLAVVKPSVQRK